MTLFSEKINLAFNSFYSKDYLSTCNLLKEAFESLIELDIKIMPSSYSISKGLIILEEFIQLPEIESTDYLLDIINEGKTILLGSSKNAFQKKLLAISMLIDLLHDLQSILEYWDEYLGGMNTSQKPDITVGIESKGQYYFYENIYEPKSMGSSM